MAKIKIKIDEGAREIIARLKVASPSECGRLVDKIIKLKIKQK